MSAEYAGPSVLGPSQPRADDGGPSAEAGTTSAVPPAEVVPVGRYRACTACGRADQPRKCRGWCKRCWQRWWRQGQPAGPLGPPRRLSRSAPAPTAECSACGDLLPRPRPTGLCRRCYARWWYYGKPQGGPPPLLPYATACGWCGRERGGRSRTRGLCQGCYVAAWRAGELSKWPTMRELADQQTA